jgi:outer membrane protein TolC
MAHPEESEMIDLPLRPIWAVPALLALGLVSAAQAQDERLGSSAQGLLDHARRNSPELRALRADAEAAAQRVAPAAALPDPVVRVELMNVNNYGNGNTPSLLPWRVGETRYSVVQSLPAWGKRGLRRDIALDDTRQADARAEAGWADLAARIKSAFADYHRVHGVQRLSREVVNLLSRLEQVALDRYAAGLGTQQDVIRAQLELTALQSELLALRGDAQQLAVRINALLARDPSAPLAEPVQPRPVPALTTADALGLADRARSRNPLIAAERARVAAAQSSRELTQRNRYPDVLVGVTPTQMGSRITTWGVMVEVNIPLQQGTRRSQEREADLVVSGAQARVDAMTQQLLGELGVGLAGLDSARRVEVLVKAQWLPQSELGLRSALSAYENGKADVAAVLEAERQLRRARQDLLKAQTDAQVRLAEIERIVGEEL